MAKIKKRKHLFGPVPSRRLGQSLGVDIVPLKTCSQNCVYCQLGLDAATIAERSEFEPIDIVLHELEELLKKGLNADYITISGSGEPTLHLGLGKLIKGIKKLTPIPVAVITNGTLFSDPQVRADAALADLVLPSLDAGDPETFETINQPFGSIDYNEFIEGLAKFKQEYSILMWLEVFFADGINTSNEQVKKIAEKIKLIKPDKIQINTAVRPPAHVAGRVSQQRLSEIRDMLGPAAEIIADYSKLPKQKKKILSTFTILDMLERRPCTAQDISDGLGASPEEVGLALQTLEKNNRVKRRTTDGKEYYLPA
jgi:wyosine [tRNA(Phe)-imidazoG37] synthetase (radical SAM superfamily)